MITKAVIPAHKIYVGLSSYGCNFRMADKGCTGPMCRFTGSFNSSEAEPGDCTDAADYISNAELDQTLRLRIMAYMVSRSTPGMTRRVNRTS